VWDRDYPVSLRETHPDGGSEFVAEFSLTPEDREQFRQVVGSALGGNLKLKLTPKRETSSFEVVIKGPSKKRLTERREKIVTFIKANLDFQYIPSVRTEAQASRVVQSMLARELRETWNTPEYTRLMAQVRDLQEPVLQRVSEAVRETISRFVPAVRQVRIEPISYATQPRIDEVRILINDGTMTPLEQKGDGIKSLTALALMRASTPSSSTKSNVILALEEPESHLHPMAIHGLRDILYDISRTHQVIITTHSPVLAARSNIASNIVVRSAHAKPARSLKEIREVLGVRLADNLVSANLVLLVEGESDRNVLMKWLGAMSAPLRNHLHNGMLVIDWLGGADKLEYKVGELKAALCNVHCFLDHDDAGRNAAESAIRNGRLRDGELSFVTCPGMAESELEDLINVDRYIDRLNAEYSIHLDPAALTATTSKWSNRIGAEFRRLGKAWNQRIASDVKRCVADITVQEGVSCIRPERRGVIDALTEALCVRLDALGH
jgi:hypothetical protein